MNLGSRKMGVTNMKISRRRLPAVAAAAAAASSVPFVPKARAAVAWDYYSFTGVTHTVTKGQLAFAEEVLKRTNGQLKITVRPAGELPFRADEAPRVVGEGQVQMASCYMGFMSGAVPIGGISGHPFLVRTVAELGKVYPIIDKYTTPEFAKRGFKTLFHFSWPPQNMFGINKPILTVGDFAGRKIRTTDPKQAEMVKRLGAASITLATAEVPVAMQRGLMEVVLTASFNLVAAKWTELVKWAWYADINVGGPNYELVNIRAYNALPADVRKVLDEVAAEFGPRMTTEFQALEVTDRQSLKSKFGIETYEASPEVIKELAGKMEPYWDEWAKQNGATAQAMMKEIRAAVGR